MDSLLNQPSDLDSSFCIVRHVRAVIPDLLWSMQVQIFASKTLINVLNRLLFSVVAVHGLGAHPDYTWTAGDVNWLRDEHMLPREIPNSRILRFGYESRWLGKEAIQQKLPLVADQLLRNMMASRKVWRNVLFPETVGLRILLGVSVATNRVHWALLWWHSHRKGLSRNAHSASH